MSGATSKRAAAVRDWPSLLERVRANRADDLRDEDYLDALQTALERRDHGPLLSLLDAGIPVITPELMPLLAEVVRDLLQGRSTGQPKALTAQDDEAIRIGFDKAERVLGTGGAHEWLSGLKGVSVDTIKRSLKRTKR